MARSVAGTLVRIVLVVFGVLALLVAYLFSQMPASGPPRVEAASNVVGVLAGGGYAWVIKTEQGAVLVDVGMEEGYAALAAELKAQDIPPESIRDVLITHGHADHWGAASHFPQATFHVGRGDAALIRGEHKPRAFMPRLFGSMVGKLAPPAKLTELQGGETLTLAGESFQVIPVPGHTPGSVMFLYKDLLFTGDSLMKKGDGVGIISGLFSDDKAQNRESLRKLLTVPFTRIADGHSGVTGDARQKLARFLE
jgi:glyoxylase-like metal-dependent hydrolase (beta-lactamase superfamily II)